jgi:hypothetical protein
MMPSAAMTLRRWSAHSKRLQTSQMKFDLDGAQWEQAVITACNASGTQVPESVRLELISNGQRTNAR